MTDAEMRPWKKDGWGSFEAGLYGVLVWIGDELQKTRKALEKRAEDAEK